MAQKKSRDQWLQQSRQIPTLLSAPSLGEFLWIFQYISSCNQCNLFVSWKKRSPWWIHGVLKIHDTSNDTIFPHQKGCCYFSFSSFSCIHKKLLPKMMMFGFLAFLWGDKSGCAGQAFRRCEMVKIRLFIWTSVYRYCPGFISCNKLCWKQKFCEYKIFDIWSDLRESPPI